MILSVKGVNIPRIMLYNTCYFVCYMRRSYTHERKRQRQLYLDEDCDRRREHTRHIDVLLYCVDNDHIHLRWHDPSIHIPKGQNDNEKNAGDSRKLKNKWSSYIFHVKLKRGWHGILPYRGNTLLCGWKFENETYHTVCRTREITLQDYLVTMKQKLQN